MTRLEKLSTVLAACCGLFLATVSAAGEPMSAKRDIFNETNLLRISIDIPSDGWETLQNSSGGRRSRQKPEAEATVREGDNVYTNVSVRLKGFSSFQPIDSLPSLTLDFNKNVPGQKFHGLSKISLNNSIQDPSHLNEKLSRELFAAAGIPVPRSDFAMVTLNGNDRGLYVLAEGFTKKFLERHFKRGDGVLYEGGILADIDRPLQIGSGKFATDDARIQQLIDTCREPDPSKRLRKLEEVLDVDRFLTLTAMETILCHSDSYSMNRNNYRLYDDPVSGKFVFIPHGMDRVLGDHRSTLDLAVVPPALGMVARAVLFTDEGRARYVGRAHMLFTNYFVPDALCRRLGEIDAKISSVKNQRPRNDVGNLCQRISTRADNLRMQFSHPNEFLTPAPSPNFDSNGMALIPHWQVKYKLGQPDVSMDAVALGSGIWHFTTTNNSKRIALRARMALPAGNYRISGELKSWDTAQVTNSISANFTCNAVNRYAVDQQPVDARNIVANFYIAKPRDPDEVELNCEINSLARELWFDASSVRIIRIQHQSSSRE